MNDDLTDLSLAAQCSGGGSKESDLSDTLFRREPDSWRVVIPGWACLDAALQLETGVRYPAFITVGGLPLYAHILKAYSDIAERSEFVLVLAEDAAEPNLEIFDGWQVTVLRLAHSSSIAQTVQAALVGIPKGCGVVVHMADTLVPGSNGAVPDAVYVQSRSDVYRWTGVNIDAAGRLQVINDRVSNATSELQLVCVGLFCLSDGALFGRCLKDCLVVDVKGEELFFKALELYSIEQALQLQNVNVWHDFGHVDSYYESRLGFCNLRHFNVLTYDADNAVVTKRSSNTEAFRHQVRWFRQVPDDVAYFLPRIYECDDRDSPFIRMELLSLPTLSDLWVSERLPLGAWNDVARKLALVLDRLRRYAFESQVAHSMVSEMYVHKTLRRIQDFLLDKPDAVHWWVYVDGHRWSLNEVMPKLDEFCAVNALLNLDVLTPIHGDLCFSNVLYDTRLRQVKLIDPRGEFGVPGIYGDARYDLAKLSHSFSGAYDLLVSDRFSAKVGTDGQLLCDLSLSPYQERVRTILKRVLLSDNALRAQCEAIESLLFLSMLPLHSDRPDRQMAMLSVGLRLFARASDVCVHEDFS